MAMRRAVLGEAHVDRAIAARTEFTREFDDFITRVAWGEIWTRPHLPRSTRSLITLAMLVALDRPEELKLHVRGALNNGVQQDELKELVLHAAVYCGVPRAHAALKTIERTLAALRAEGAAG
jgi:4-carboxymuconolactone decarboxylase